MSCARIVALLAAASAAMLLASCGRSSDTASVNPASSVQAPDGRPDSLEFKGMVIGRKDEAAVLAYLKKDDYCRKQTKGLATGSCRTFVSYGGVIAPTIDLWFNDGELTHARVLLKPADFDSLMLTMAEKYGPHQSEQREEMQNAFGAKFTNRIITWTAKDGSEVLALKYVNDITTAAVDLRKKPTEGELRMQSSRPPKTADL